MIYILLVILTATSFNILFKVFEKYNINTLQAIIANYVTAFIISLFLSPISYSLGEMVTHGWFYTGIALGIMYFVTMCIYSLSTIHIGVALTAMLTRTSLIIPTSVSLLFLDETFSWIDGAAIVMILIALYFIFFTKNEQHKGTRSSLWLTILLPLAVFVGCGCNDVLLKVSQFFYIKNEADNSSFISVVYFMALLFGVGSYFLSAKNRKQRFTMKAILWGTLMGAFNIINSVSILKALKQLPASVIFPIVNIGIVVLATFVGVCFYHEKLTVRKIIGITIALVAILLLK